MQQAARGVSPRAPLPVPLHLPVLLLLPLLALATLGLLRLSGEPGPTPAPPSTAPPPGPVAAPRSLVDVPLLFLQQGPSFAVRGVGTSLDLGRGGIDYAYGRPGAAARLRLELVGAADAMPVGRAPSDAVVARANHADQALPAYAQVVYPDVWPGIDLVLHGDQRTLKYAFHVKRGADPSQIALRWQGSGGVRLATDGSLAVATTAGTLHDAAPVAWQDGPGGRQAVGAAWQVSGTTATFALGAHDPSLPLVIDPAQLLWAGYVGGPGMELAPAIAVDASGATYLVGQTDGLTAAGGHDTSFNGASDGFLTKINPEGTAVVYTTFIGGAGVDGAIGVAVDATGAAYVTGWTAGGTFPDGQGLSDSRGIPGTDFSYNGGASDAYAVKLDPTGVNLVYAGLIGGSGTDSARGIAVDATGAAYIAGNTDFTTEASFPDGNSMAGRTSFDATANGGPYEGWAVKLTPRGDDFAYAGFIGGSGLDNPYAIAIDGAGAAYVAGESGSVGTSFPDGTGIGARPSFDASGNGGSDAFLVKIAPAGTSTEYAGLLGGSGREYAFGVAVDAQGAAYLTGGAGSSEATFPDGDGFGALPTVDGTYNGGSDDAFVAKVAPGGATLAYAGYIGGSGTDWGTAVAVDAAGRLTVSGNAGSAQATFPDGDGFGALDTFDGTFNSTGATQQDGFVARVAAAGTALDYAGYLGGSGTLTQTAGVALDAQGRVSVAGSTNADGASFPDGDGLGALPTFNGTKAGPFDAFAARIAPSDSGPGGGGGGGGVVVPISVTAVGGASKSMVGSTWVNVRGVPTTGADMVRTEFDLDVRGPFQPDFGCGPDSTAASIAFASKGSHTVGIRVVDSLGFSAVTTQVVTMPAATKRLIAAPVYTCENPGANNQPDRADCVKTFGMGILEINSRGRATDCWQIDRRITDLIRAPREVARARQGRGIVPVGPGSSVFTYRGRIRGPIAVNGLYLPLAAERETVFDGASYGVSLGTVDARVGPYTIRGLRFPANLPYGVPRAGIALGEFNVGGDGFLGRLPLAGQVAVRLYSHESGVNVRVKLPTAFSFGDGKAATGEVSVRNNNRDGFRLASAHIDVPSLFLGPVALSKFFLDYRDEAGQQVWQGAGELKLSALSPAVLRAHPDGPPPNPDNGFRLVNGAFASAGAVVDFSDSATPPEIFPGVSLQRIGFSAGVKPLRFTGTVGVAAARVINVDGTLLMVFATPRERYVVPDLGGGLSAIQGYALDTTAFAVGGQVSLKVPVLGSIPLATGHVLYAYPDFFQAGGEFEFKVFPGVFTMKGGVLGWVQAGSGKFNVEGRVEACLIGACVGQVEAVVSSAGIGFCAGFNIDVDLLITEVKVRILAGIGYRWGDTLPDIHLFTCSIQPYREASPFAGRRLRDVAAGGTFTLPAGLPAATIRVVGTGGAPTVAITGPDGTRIEASKSSVRNADAPVLMFPEQGLTVVGLKSPKAGRYTVEPIAPPAGAVPAAITDIAVANGVKEPTVKARVSGTARARTLTYTVANLAAGQTVAFAEHGVRTYRVLGRARGGSGTIRFAPGEGAKGSREILAILEQGGAPLRTIRVATYTAPPPARPARPTRAKAKRARAALVVTWKRVPGVRSYAVTINMRSGQRRMVVVSRGSARFADVSTGAGAVSIVSVGANGQRSTPATVRIAKVVAKPRR